MPNFEIESQFTKSVFGVDEVGRGALAGPVVAVAVYCPVKGCVLNVLSSDEAFRRYIDLLTYARDSKKLTKNQREVLYCRYKQHILFGLGIATNTEVDELNVLRATFLAMQRAVGDLEKRISIVVSANVSDGSTLCIKHLKVCDAIGGIIVDGNRAPIIGDYNVLPVIRGDDCSYTVAAASIIAKVTRDDIMTSLSSEHSEYRWDRNCGYVTAAHKAAIRQYSYTAYHRRSWKVRI